MPNCYRCNIELLPKEKVNSESINKKRFASREHIIPNLRNLISVDEPLNERINFDHHTVGSEATYRAIAKIALNFYLFKGHDIQWVRELIPYVTQKGKTNLFTAFFYSFMEIHQIDTDEVSHILFLKGDSRKQLLYCYIELYNVYNFIVIINDEFTGTDFEETYCYEVLKKLELNKKVKLSLYQNVLKRMYNDEVYSDQRHKNMQEEFSKRFYRLLKKLNSCYAA